MMRPPRTRNFDQKAVFFTQEKDIIALPAHPPYDAHSEGRSATEARAVGRRRR